MLRPSAALLVAFALLAGCVAENAPAGELAPANGSAVSFAEDYQLGNATVPKEELQNATLGSEHVHDLWGGAEELVLADETFAGGNCEGPVDAAAYALVTTFAGEGPAYGCARIRFPEGTVVPEGAGLLRFEVDATDALKSGSMQVQWRSKGHEVEGDPSSEPRHTWTFELTEADWDLPHATATTFVMYVGARGAAGVFEGPVKVRVVASRLSGWEPILAVAHVDHWKLDSLHDFPAPGVMRLLDAEASVTNVDPARLTGGGAPQPIAFADIVPPGAKAVTIVADTTATDCAPVLRCWYVPELVVGGYDRTYFGELLHEDGARRIYGWTVPDEVPEDSVYANASSTTVNGRIDACAVGDAGRLTCGFASIASNKASARLQAFAWKDEVDLDLLATLAPKA